MIASGYIKIATTVVSRNSRWISSFITKGMTGSSVHSGSRDEKLRLGIELFGYMGVGVYYVMNQVRCESHSRSFRHVVGDVQYQSGPFRTDVACPKCSFRNDFRREIRASGGARSGGSGGRGPRGGR